jgi:hypothetical protein
MFTKKIKDKLIRYFGSHDPKLVLVLGYLPKILQLKVFVCRLHHGEVMKLVRKEAHLKRNKRCYRLFKMFERAA